MACDKVLVYSRAMKPTAQSPSDKTNQKSYSVKMIFLGKTLPPVKWLQLCTVTHELVILAPHTHMNMAHCNLQHEHSLLWVLKRSRWNKLKTPHSITSCSYWNTFKSALYRSYLMIIWMWIRWLSGPTLLRLINNTFNHTDWNRAK